MSNMDSSLLFTFMHGSVGIPDIVVMGGMITNGSRFLFCQHGRGWEG
jgi:hypothetical protein